MDNDVLRAGEGRSLWVVGDRYTIKATGEETGGAFALVEALVPPGGGPPPHIHGRAAKMRSCGGALSPFWC
jgi:hypothetical protein